MTKAIFAMNKPHHLFNIINGNDDTRVCIQSSFHVEFHADLLFFKLYHF